MNMLDAAHLIGHEYPGGAKTLAERLGINQVVFNSKLNPNTTTHHLTLIEALRMQQIADRFDVLHAMADELGFVCIRKPMIGDDCVTLSITRTCAEFGDFMREVNETLQDNNVTANELREVQKELLELIAASTALNRLLEAKQRGSRPHTEA
jgi:hypothetical protein